MLHLLGTVIFTLSLLTVVDDRIFPIDRGDFSNADSQGNAFSILTQPAMTSIISLTLVFHRLTGGAWLTLAGWRMAFTVLELEGASFSDMGRMINYRCPPLRSPFTGWQASLLPTMWVVFLLATPSLFTSPLLTGAVNWIPTELHQHLDASLKIPQHRPSNKWNEHNIYNNSTLYEVYSAIGLASTANLLDFNLSVPATYKRYLPLLPIMPPNSTVASITVPVFRMNYFKPIRDRTEIHGDFAVVESVITDLADANQNFSSPTNMFNYGTDEGRLTVVQTIPWQAAKSDYSGTMYEYPTATTVTERKLVIVVMQRNQSCAPEYSNKFGSFQDLYAYENAGSCYVFFDLNFTAGITICKDCQVQSNGLTPGGLVTINDASAEILPDPLVETAIAMIPDVLFYTEIANSSFAPTFNNLDGYVRGMLSTAYQASWSSLTRFFLNNSFAETSYQRPVPGLVAYLSKGKVITWCILNSLLVLSAILLYVVQRRCSFKAVVKPWLSSLVMDTSAVTAHDVTGLCNARKLDEQDKMTHVRLLCHHERTGQDAYKHPVMVKVDRSRRDAYSESIQLLALSGK